MLAGRVSAAGAAAGADCGRISIRRGSRSQRLGDILNTPPEPTFNPARAALPAIRGDDRLRACRRSAIGSTGRRCCTTSASGSGRAGGRHRRPVGLRQEHAGQAGAAAVRARERPGAGRRRRSRAWSTSPGCAARSASCCRRTCCSTARSATTSRWPIRPCRWSGSSRRRSSPARTSSSSSCRRATTPSSASAAARCPAASASASRSRARSITDPRILIFDEATSALDYESERIIQDNMRAIAQRPHGLHHRAPALDRARGRSHHHDRARPDRRGRHARRADRRTAGAMRRCIACRRGSMKSVRRDPAGRTAAKLVAKRTRATSWRSCRPRSRSSRRRPRRSAARSAAAIIALFCLALAWACFGKVDIVATAQGKIVPSGRTKIVQPFETGVSARNPRARRAAGQGRRYLDRTRLHHQRGRARPPQERLVAARLDVARLRAALAEGDDPVADFHPPEGSSASGRHPAAIPARADGRASRQDRGARPSRCAQKAAEPTRSRRRSRSSKPLSRLPSNRSTFARRCMIVKPVPKSSISKTWRRWSISRRSWRSRKASCRKPRRRSPRSSRRARSRSRVPAHAVWRTRRGRAQGGGLARDVDKAERADPTAGADGAGRRRRAAARGAYGWRRGDARTGAAGGGAKRRPVEVKAMVSNRDIGFVQAGQRAEIKVDTFNFTRYGLLHGKVVSVSPGFDRQRKAKGQVARHVGRGTKNLERAAGPGTGLCGPHLARPHPDAE